MENHENLIGKVLGGRYKIQAIVGEGGMSVVMKAYDALKMRDVTIKLLSHTNTGEPHAVERNRSLPLRSGFCPSAAYLSIA